jgi:hypothetical protein
MGFGLLFTGYTMLLVWGITVDPELGLGFDILPDLLGYLLFWKGLQGLRPYSKNFVFSRYLTYPLMAAGGVTLAAQGVALVGKWVPSIAKHWELLLSINNIVDIISLPLLLFFHAYLCLGIRELAEEVELPKIVSRTKVAIVLSSAYYFGQILVGLVPMPGFIHMMLVLLTFIVYFYYLYMLYSCYMHIVYADEEPKEVFNPLMSLLDKMKKKDSDDE